MLPVSYTHLDVYKRQVLRLEGDPDVARVECILELRVEAELPAGIVLLLRRIFGPQAAAADRFFGGDQRGGKPLRVRSFEFVIDPEGCLLYTSRCV